MVNCPGIVIVITPPQVHMHVLSWVRMGKGPTRIVGFIGIQGAAVAGTQGAGVKTPALAAVDHVPLVSKE